MKSQELRQELERGKIRPFYYFYGPERSLIAEAVSRIEEKTLNPATREFNREIIDAGEEDIRSVVGKFHTLPLRSSMRLLVIRDADGIWKREAAALISYFEDPNPTTCVVFVGERADLRIKFFQVLEKKGAAVAFYPPSPREILRYLQTVAQQAGHSLSEDAASLLLELIGPSLQDLNGEVQKIASSLKKGEKIEMADVRKLTEDTRLESPFELPKAIGRLDLKGTLSLFRKIWQQGDAPPLLLSLILRHLRILRRAQEMKKRKFSPREIETRLHILPWETEDFWEEVRTLSPLFWEEAWKLSLKVDRGLKSSRGDKDLLFEEYLWALHHLEIQKEFRAVRRNPALP